MVLGRAESLTVASLLGLRRTLLSNGSLVPNLYVCRHFSVLLCTISLLIGNVAGWMHLGCVPSSSCCVQSDVDLADESRQHACCHHSHRHRATQQDSGQHQKYDVADFFAADSLPAQPGCPDEHDSKRCSICQSFFAARNGASICQPATVDCDVAVEFVTGFEYLADYRDPFWHSISVRGPPQV